MSAGFSGISSGGVKVNSTTAPAAATPTADGGSVVNYKTTFANGETLDLAYEFHPDPRPQSFAGTNFTLPAGASKWTVSMLGWPFGNDPAMTTFEVGHTVTVGDGQEGIANVLVQHHTPQPNMTTFVVLMDGPGDLAVRLETFDVVEVDGEVVYMPEVRAQASATKVGELEVTLTFPRFAQRLTYDPNIYMITIDTQRDYSSASAGPSAAWTTLLW